MSGLSSWIIYFLIILPHDYRIHTTIEAVTRLQDAYSPQGLSRYSQLLRPHRGEVESRLWRQDLKAHYRAPCSHRPIRPQHVSSFRGDEARSPMFSEENHRREAINLPEVPLLVQILISFLWKKSKRKTRLPLSPFKTKSSPISYPKSRKTMQASKSEIKISKSVWSQTHTLLFSLESSSYFSES